MLRQLHEVMTENVTLNLTIMKRGTEVIVMMVAKTTVDDPAYENMPPITASGTPEEVESDLLKAIIAPIKEFGNSIEGVKEFLDKKAEADKTNSKKKAEKKEAEKAEEKESKKSAKSESTSEKAKPKARSKFETEFDKLLADGEKAIAEKRDISAKAIRAKMQNLIDSEQTNGVDGEIMAQFCDYKDSIDKLEADRSKGNLFDTVASATKPEPVPQVAEVNVDFDAIADELDSKEDEEEFKPENGISPEEEF